MYFVLMKKRKYVKKEAPKPRQSHIDQYNKDGVIFDEESDEVICPLLSSEPYKGSDLPINTITF